MTSLNDVARHSREPVWRATPSRETRLCTVQPGWRTFDPNILHAGCTKSSAGRLIEIEGGPPPRRSPAKAGLVLARLQSTRDTSYLFRRRC